MLLSVIDRLLLSFATLKKWSAKPVGGVVAGVVVGVEVGGVEGVAVVGGAGGLGNGTFAL